MRHLVQSSSEFVCFLYPTDWAKVPSLRNGLCFFLSSVLDNVDTFGKGLLVIVLDLAELLFRFGLSVDCKSLNVTKVYMERSSCVPCCKMGTKSF